MFQVFSLDRPDIFGVAFNPSSSKESRYKSFEKVAAQIATLCATLSEFPHIRHRVWAHWNDHGLSSIFSAYRNFATIPQIFDIWVESFFACEAEVEVSAPFELNNFSFTSNSLPDLCKIDNWIWFVPHVIIKSTCL